MPNSEKIVTLLDDLAALDAAQRRVVAEALRKMSETCAEVPNGGNTAHTVGLLAHLLDPS